MTGEEMSRQKKKLKDADQVIITCAKCGHEHKYESLKILDTISMATPCTNCGFLFLQHTVNKMAMMRALLKTDEKAVALLKTGKLDEFEKYLKEKTKL